MRIKRVQNDFRVFEILDESLLQFEAEEDMKVVGDLVRLNADERSRHLIHGGIESVHVDSRQLLGKSLL